MNHCMTGGAVALQKRALVVRAATWTVGELRGDTAMAFETELAYLVAFQQSRVGGTVRCVTCRTSFDLHRGVFKNERPLFVSMAFHARCVRSHRQPGLFRFKTAVCIVTIAAFHRAFQNFVPEWLVEMRFGFAVAGNTELLFAGLEHRGRRIEVRRVVDERHRADFELAMTRAVCRVAFRTADVVAPMLAASKIIMAFLT